MNKFDREPGPAEQSPDRSNLAEQHHREMWDRIKDGEKFGYADTLKRGKEMGISPEELENYARGVISKKIWEKDYLFVFRFGRFMRTMDVGTDETIKDLHSLAYKAAIQNGHYDEAANLALETYGMDSPEYIEAVDGWKKMAKQKAKQPKNSEPEDGTEEIFKKGEDGPIAVLKPSATLSDLFRILDMIEERAAEGTTEGEETEDGATHFEAEIFDNFEQELADDILDLKAQLSAMQFKETGDHNEEEKALAARGEEKLLDYFNKRGYSKEDIEAFLPLKFKKKHKKR